MNLWKNVMAKERDCLAMGYFSMATLPSKMKPARLPARIGDHRIRLHSIFHKKRTGYKRQRSQRIYPVFLPIDQIICAFGVVKHRVMGSWLLVYVLFPIH
uniref:Uncharacterized protein n=1 Tax=Chenopodium quinoa TaxID=63459 RepID=A0A803MDQ4_CHEQI